MCAIPYTLQMQLLVVRVAWICTPSAFFVVYPSIVRRIHNLNSVLPKWKILLPRFHLQLVGNELMLLFTGAGGQLHSSKASAAAVSSVSAREVVRAFTISATKG